MYLNVPSSTILGENIKDLVVYSKNYMNFFMDYVLKNDEVGKRKDMK